MKSGSYKENFQKIYDALNADQKKAVDQIEGPVLVIAGPGTGKTQLLAARVANILIKTDVMPENILCLTYTDAGTIAMRKRLNDFIGPDSYRVNIFTFHSFCNLVIQENLDVFGFRSLDPISELEQIQVLREIVESFPKNHMLKRYTGDVYYEVGRLLGLYEIMKKEDWTPDFIKSKVNSYIEEMPLMDKFLYQNNSKHGKKGELKKKLFDAEAKKMKQLEAAVNTFDVYQEKLKKLSRYDFADMILWVIYAFKKNEELLASYQEKYQYILVDEFQDTSGSQNELLNLLLSYWESPNIFVVGDDDQSIFKFQGANIENIQKFSLKYKSDLSVVKLSENYRSSQYILDASCALISKNEERLSSDKQLIACSENAKLENKPEIRTYVNSIHEIAAITLEIEKLKNSGVAPKEIAVLYRNHAQAADMIKYLQQKQIGVNTKRKVDALHEPLIVKLITILKYVIAETSRANSAENLLYEILHYSEFNICATELARLSVEINNKNRSEKKSSWRIAISELNKKKQASLFEESTHSDALVYAGKTLETLISNVHNQTVLEFISSVLTSCNLLANALTNNEKMWNLQLLSAFFDFVKSECARKPHTKLAGLVELLELMSDNSVSLPVHKLSYSEDGVNFITAHSSKGLEFDYVFVIGCNSNIWDKSQRSRTYSIPENVFDLNAGDETEEARRLFYVAMTRAKKSLVLSYAERNMNDKELESSRFLSEILEGYSPLKSRVILGDEELVKFSEAIFINIKSDKKSDLIDLNFAYTLLENYSLSVTHLNTFLRCPLSFYFNNLVKVPAPKNASMSFGSAVHFGLEQLFKKMNAHEEKEFPSKEVLLKDFEWYMYRNLENFVKKDFDRLLEYGGQILPAYYDTYIAAWNKITSIERSYRNVVVENVALNGKLDKLEFDNNVVNVVDYKTGQFQRAKSKLYGPNPESVELAMAENKPIKHEDEFGGDYWRQAVFYKILIDNDKTKTWDVRSVEFDFIEPDKESNTYVKHRVNITPQDVAIVKQQIVSVYDKIRNKEFSEGCNDDDCHWCNFKKAYDKGRNVRIKQLPFDEEEI